MIANVGAKPRGMTEAKVANSVGSVSESRSSTEVNYGRWLREGDAEELVYAIGRRSDEHALVKRDDRTGNVCFGSGGQDCGSRGADEKKRFLEWCHYRQREGLAKCKGGF